MYRIMVLENDPKIRQDILDALIPLTTTGVVAVGYPSVDYLFYSSKSTGGSLPDLVISEYHLPLCETGCDVSYATGIFRRFARDAQGWSREVAGRRILGFLRRQDVPDWIPIIFHTNVSRSQIDPSVLADRCVTYLEKDDDYKDLLEYVRLHMSIVSS